MGIRVSRSGEQRDQVESENLGSQRQGHFRLEETSIHHSRLDVAILQHVILVLVDEADGTGVQLGAAQLREMWIP